MVTKSLQDTARERADALRKAIRSGLTDFVVESTKYNETGFNVSLRDPDETSLVTVTVQATKRNYATAVVVSIRPSWEFRRGGRRTITYWADHKKDFKIDPTRVIAKIAELAVTLKADRVAAAARKVEQTAHMERRVAAGAPIRAAIRDLRLVAEPRTYMEQLSDWGVSEGYAEDGSYRYTFDVKLRDLTKEQFLAILPLLNPAKPTGGNNSE